MAEKNKVPLMLEMIFGAAAGAAQQGASEQLLEWGRAFDAWLAERQGRYQEGAHKQARLAWSRLLQQQRKLPWELTQADIEGHAAWLEAKGYAASSIANAIGYFADFYEWRRIRAGEAERPNPAAMAKRPKVGRYAGAALLQVCRQDHSAVGLRDWAFFLARLRLGVPTREIRMLQWGQIEREEGDFSAKNGASPRNNMKMKLPGEVWEAIRAYLAASRRLAGMRAETYIFAPLAFPGRGETGWEAADWQEERPVAQRTILTSLKIYGRAAGIEEDKLSLMALRRTATRLRLEAGDGLEEMQVFLGSREERRFTKYRLGMLPQLPAEAGKQEGAEEAAAQAPRRQARPFKAGEGMTHGLYARRQPPEAVAKILAENIQGIEEQIVGMRTLGSRLLELFEEAESEQEAARLGNAYTLAAARLAEMIKTEKPLKKTEKEKWVEDMQALYRELAPEQGWPPLSDDAATVGSGEGGGDPRRLGEQIAATQYILRNTLALAMQAENTDDFVRLVEHYNLGCHRLLTLLRVERGDQSRLVEQVEADYQQALEEVMEEFGLTERDDL